jgi:hypothetical protein
MCKSSTTKSRWSVEAERTAFYPSVAEPTRMTLSFLANIRPRSADMNGEPSARNVRMAAFASRLFRGVPETGLLQIIAFLSLAASHRATRSVSSALNQQIREKAHTPANEFVEGVVIQKVRRR